MIIKITFNDLFNYLSDWDCYFIYDEFYNVDIFLCLSY